MSEPDVPVLDRFSLAGKIALVTGASSGLGAGFAVALDQAGADVVLAARRLDRLEAISGKIEKLGRSALLSRPKNHRPGCSGEDAAPMNGGMPRRSSVTRCPASASIPGR